MNGTLALTWVPNPKDIGIKPIFQFESTIGSIVNLGLCCDYYEMYPELTVAGNIHYHGVIRVKDKIKWYKKVLPTLRYKGYVCVKKDPDEKWKEYIRKDKDIMERILCRNFPIQYCGGLDAQSLITEKSDL